MAVRITLFSFNAKRKTISVERIHVDAVTLPRIGHVEHKNEVARNNREAYLIYETL